MTDQEYIKMILALPDEFFAGWEWKAGDKYLINYGDYWDIGFIGDSSIENGEAGYYFITVGEFQKFREELRPVPSQEQLQELIQNNWLKLDPTVQSYGVLKYFCNWFRANWVSYPAYKEVETKSINSIWLRYTMWMIYNKEWNGESWI